MVAFRSLEIESMGALGWAWGGSLGVPGRPRERFRGAETIQTISVPTFEGCPRVFFEKPEGQILVFATS